MMIASIPRRISGLKRLAKEYYVLDTGALIQKPEELLRVFDIRGSMHHDNHPHRMARVYFSRKALKHFVESRKDELAKNHTDDEALKKIFSAIERIQEVITDFDIYEFEPPKHFYIKRFSHIGEPSLRTLLEMKMHRLEIASIHFTKNRKK